MTAAHEKELLKELRKSWNLQTSLFELIEKIQDIQNIDRLWEIIAQFCQDSKMIGAAGCLIIKKDDINGLETVYVTPLLKTLRLNEKSNLAESVIKKGSYLSRSEVLETELNEWGLANLEATAILATPIKIRGNIWGAILLWHEEHGRLFEATHTDLLQMCAYQAAAVLGFKSAADAELKSWHRISGEIAGLIQDPVTLMDIWLDDFKANSNLSKSERFDAFFQKMSDQIAEIDQAARRFLEMASEEGKFNFEKVIAHNLVEEMIQEAFPESDREKFKIVSPEANDIYVDVHKSRFKLALRQLFLAAHQLSDGGNIKVELKISDNKTHLQIEIIVKSENIGIPPQDKQKVFKPEYFLMSEKPRLQLSLMLAKKFIDQQKGELKESGEAPDEIRFQIQLPLYKFGGLQ